MLKPESEIETSTRERKPSLLVFSRDCSYIDLSFLADIHQPTCRKFTQVINILLCIVPNI